MGARLRLALLFGMSGVLLVLLGYAAHISTVSLLEASPQSWGMSHLSDAVVAGTCTIGALGSLWHLASAALALTALPRPHDHGPSQKDGDPGLASRILEAWGAPAVRRMAASALVVSLSSAPALAAGESSGGDDLGWRPTSSAPVAPSQTPSNGSGESAADSPPSTPDERPSAVPNTHVPSEHTHTVRPGESLWSITAGLLPDGSAPAQIAQTWPVLYHANADVIGQNPSLIRPGAVLSIPSALTAPPTTTGGRSPSR